MREEVPPPLAGERVDKVIALITGRPRGEIADLVRAGKVTLSGRVVSTRSQRVEAGELLVVDEPDAAPPAALDPDPTVELVVVHADEDVIVIDKPAGLVVHPGAGNRAGTLVQGVLARYPEVANVGEAARPGIVHRLDKGTSGLLVVARSPRAYGALVEQLRRRDAERRYQALVWGLPDSPAGIVDAPIGRANRDRTRMAVSGEGKEARTRYEVRRRWPEPGVALLECRLETGRTHQIRVHLAAIGHPVVGDGRYGGKRKAFLAPRPFLHADRLAFLHPGTGERVEYASELPADLVSLLESLDLQPT